MRVGLISDIHGNRLALDAVVAELEKEDLDQIVCLGDVAVGPQPAEALAGVRELGCLTVMGNWDACFLEGMPEAKDEVGQKLVDTGEWWAQFLSDEDREFMRSFAPTLEIDLDGLEALFFHGSPVSYDDWIFATTPDDELRTMLDGHPGAGAHRRPYAPATRPPVREVDPRQPRERRTALRRVVAPPRTDRPVGRVRDHLVARGTARGRAPPNDLRRRGIPEPEPKQRNAPRRLVGGWERLFPATGRDSQSASHFRRQEHTCQGTTPE